mgnify:CR=1 FL=1
MRYHVVFTAACTFNVPGLKMPPNINIKQIWDVMNRSGKYFDNVLTKVRKVEIIYLIISIIIYNIMKSMVEILQKISQFCSTCIL